MADLDRQYISQYSVDGLGLSIMIAGVATDVDDNRVDVSFFDEDTLANAGSKTADHEGTGLYHVPLSPDDTATLGNYTANWSYQIEGVGKNFIGYFQIGGAQPPYDNLSSDLKLIVDQVWIRFADMFDSEGGPHLQTYWQANFNRGRIAQLLGMAMRRLNTVAQPTNNYSPNPALGSPFPTALWGPLLEQATYVEVIKHLRRSYIEQPDYQGQTISRLDRQRYVDKWTDLLRDEEVQLQSQMDVFKISQMGLGRPAVLVSGGIYGRYTPVSLPGMAGRPRLWNVAYL